MRKVLLTTDLYHPHNDPNDHWNLATLYSLARKRKIRFAGVLCDEDKPDRVRGFQTYGDPSVQSVAQLNYISGIAVPEAVGSHKPMTCEEDIREVLSSGIIIPSVEHIISVLEDGGEVDIHLCGSCRDVLLAARKRPDLFTEKVRIFLNAGTYADQTHLEYNVSLEPYSFSQMFTLPCQIMWAPCFDTRCPGVPFRLSERANYYWIMHEDVFPRLSRQMKNFFSYMYAQEKETGWLTYIQGPIHEDVLEKFGTGKRQMWSTPGFLMSAGYSLRPDGSETGEFADDALFGYLPAVVSARPDGRLNWRPAEENEKTNVKMFFIRDIEKFQPVMAEAVTKLLEDLP